MRKTEGESNQNTLLCKSLIEDDISIYNLEGISDSTPKPKIKDEKPPSDSIYNLDNYIKDNSFDICKEIENFLIYSDTEDNGKSSHAKINNKQYKNPKERSSQPNLRLQGYIPPQGNSHKDLYGPSPSSQQFYRPFFANSNINSSFPSTTLKPQVIPFYNNHSNLSQPQLMYYHPPTYNNYNIGILSSNGSLPCNKFVPGYPIIQNTQIKPIINRSQQILNPFNNMNFSKSSANLQHPLLLNKSINIKPSNTHIDFGSSQTAMTSLYYEDMQNCKVSAQTAGSQFEELKKDKGDCKSEFVSSGNKLIDYLCTSKGCRYFQGVILKASPETIDQIIIRIGNEFHIVMTDSHANYFFQKFIGCCNQSQRVDILKYVFTKFLYITNDSSGTHAIQAMFDLISTPEEIDIISLGIKPDFLEICKGLNSNHIVQKLLTCIPEDSRKDINFLVIENASSLVYDAHGICVVSIILIKILKLKKFLTEYTTDRPYKDIWDAIKANSLLIIQDLYGNYIVQLILELGLCKEVIQDIVNIVIINLKELAIEKVSSNVVERCLEHGDEVRN